MCAGNAIGTTMSLCAAAALVVMLSGCGGSDSGDDSVRMTGQAPSAEAAGGAAGSSGTNGAVDTSKLVSPVSQAPVGRQTIRDVRTPQGQDANPPRHP